MVTINKLTATDVVSAADSVPIWQAGSRDARKVAFSVLAAAIAEMVNASLVSDGTFAGLTGKPTDSAPLKEVLDAKQDKLPSGGTPTTFLAGDGTWRVPAGLGGGSISWGSIPGLLTDQTDLKNALDSKQTKFTTGGTALQYIRGDMTLATLDRSAVGLGNVNNTTDAAKPVSAATAAAIQAISKSSIGLSQVDNTSDLSKPISSATISALSLKANASNAVLTEIPTADTAPPGTNTRQLATTAFVMTALGVAPSIDPLVASTMTNLNNVSAAMRLRTLIIGAE